jgi:diacylglycerol kinase
MKQPKFSQSLRHAVDGLVYTLQTQRNARIHLGIAALVATGAVWLVIDIRGWCLLALTIGGVWTAELFNTAIEAAVDLLSPDYHERAKIAKDVAAGAVLVMSLTAIIVGLCVLGPPLWVRLIPVS